MKNLKFIIIFSSMVVLASCHKHNEATTASITFIEPTEGDTLQFGEELHVEGTIKGNGELHGYSINFMDSNSGQNLLSKSTHDHAETYSFHEHWMNNATDTINVKIVVDVDVNHDGGKASNEINVVCLPN
jgi:hypothetical protein